MIDMPILCVTAYHAGFPPAAHAEHAAAPAVAWAPQAKRRTAATDPSVDRGFS